MLSECSDGAAPSWRDKALAGIDASLKERKSDPVKAELDIAMKSRREATVDRPPAKRRGPKPTLSDAELLAAIRADLTASPWQGEGHRKVWARLRVRDGIRASRKRALRIMRENNLLSPHRCRRRDARAHDGEIVTDAPNVMWGTDGVRVFTADDGWGWIFTAVEHWNAECVGWHACKIR